MNFASLTKVLGSFLLLLTTTLCYSQFSPLPPIQQDSWTYVTKSGEIRYDLSKYRVQIMERKGRQLQEMESVYGNSQEFIRELLKTNDELMADWIGLTSKMDLIEQRNQEILAQNVELTARYNNSLVVNERLKEKLKSSRKNFAGLAATGLGMAIIAVVTILK